MTADEREKIGELNGTVRALERRLGKIEELIGKLDEKLDAMQLHVAPAAARLAEELASYRVDEAKWKVEVVGPLVEVVKKLERGEIAGDALASLRRSQRTARRWLVGLSVTVAIAVAGFVIDYLRIRYHT